MKLYFLTPNYFVNEVVRIHYKKDEISRKSTLFNALKPEIITERDKMLQAEYKAIDVIKRVPKGLLAKNHKNIAGYKKMDRNQAIE
jgi:hypothetical protein